jgi:HEAT repeat protein
MSQTQAGDLPAHPADSLTNLLAALASGDETRTEAAVAELRALPEALWTEALEALQGLLRSPDPDRRWWAVRWLAALPSSEITPSLLQALNDEDAPVRQCAAVGLRQRPDPQAVPGLVRALDDPDPLVRRLAGEALRATGSEAVPKLLEVMESGSHPARLEAARALANIGDTRAIPALFKALDDSALLEYWAGEGLERMGVGMSFFLPTTG